MRPLVLLAGYGQSHSITTFYERVRALDALVLDVRLYPTSRREEWRRYDLELVLGERYRHWPCWGNRNYKGNLSGPRFQIANWPAGVRMLAGIERQGRYRVVILLCACRSEREIG